MTEAVYPNNFEFEQTVIGAVIDRPDLFFVVGLTAEDFFDDQARAIWMEIARRMTNDPPLPIAAETLISCKTIDARMVARCVGVVAGGESILYEANHLKHLTRCRRLAKDAYNIAAMALRADDYDSMAVAVESAFHQLTEEKDTNYETEKNITESAWNRYSNRLTQDEFRIDMGMSVLDDMLHGFRGGRLYCIAGRPGDGKSALALKLIDSAVRAGVRTNFHSLEMGPQEIIDRWVAMRTGIRHGRIAYAVLLREEKQYIREELLKIQEVRNTLRLYCSGTQSVAKIQGEIRRSKPKLVVVDYLQLLHADAAALGLKAAATRDRELSQMTSRLKALARDADCPIVILSQLNRSIERRDDSTPQLADLRESGGIEADCDVVMFCVRGKQQRKTEDQQTIDDGRRILRVAKNRHGRTGSVLVQFDFATMRVGEIDNPEGL